MGLLAFSFQQSDFGKQLRAISFSVVPADG
jgi:hypothetical protein